MDIFLEKRNYNKLELFKCLTTEIKGITVEDMEIYLNLSTISIKRSLLELEGDLLCLYKQDIQLIKYNAMYFLLLASNKQRTEYVDTLTLYYLKQSVPFSTILSLIETPYASLDQALNSIPISVSYYYKIYKKIRPWLNNWGVDINFIKKNTNLSGSQLHTRFFLYYFYWNSFKGTEWPFTNVSKEFILSYSSFFYKEALPKINPSEQCRMTYHLAIFFENAIKNKNYVHISSQNKQIMKVFKDVHDLSTPLVQMANLPQLSIPENILENEQLYFNFIARLTSTTLDSDMNKQKIGEKLLLLNNPIVHYCKSLLLNIVKYFKLDCSSKQYYYLIYITTIYCFSNTTLNLDHHIFVKKHPTKEMEGTTAKIESKELTAKIEYFLTQFNATCPEKKIAKEMFQYPNVFYNYIYFIILYLDKHKLSVFVNYSKNIYSEALIKKKLLSTLSNNTLVIVDNIDDADIIVSDCTEHTLKAGCSFFLIDDISEIETWINLINHLMVLVLEKNFYF